MSKDQAQQKQKLEDAVKALVEEEKIKTELELKIDLIHRKPNSLEQRKQLKKQLWDSRQNFLTKLQVVLDLGKAELDEKGSKSSSVKSEGASPLSY